MCKLKMKVIIYTLFIVLLAAIAKADAVENSKKVEPSLQVSKVKEVVKKITENDSSKSKEVHKRGIFHGEGLGHYATYPQFAQQALWPKSYASQYAYSVRPVGLSAFGPSVYRPKPFFAAAAGPTYSVLPAQHAAPHANSYVLRPGGASVSSYSATYPRYHARPAYTVPHVAPVQPFVPAVAPVQPVAPPVIQPSYSVQPVAAPLPPPPQQQPQQYFFQTQFLPPTPVQAPIFTAPQPLPQYPPIAFAPESPAFVTSVPQIPAIPQVPQLPNVPAQPTPPPANVIFPFNFQPPGPQQPPAFGAFPVGAEFPSFGTVGQNPVDSGSAVASPQIPAPPSTNPPQVPQQQPELPPIQSPPTQAQSPWRPIYSAPNAPSQPRPPITLQPPYGSPSSGYLPPAASSQSQAQVQQYQVNENYYDELSDAEIENIFHQSKYVPHHAHHLQRQADLVYQHHY